MMKIPLTISLLASSRIGSLERCLDSLKPLLTRVPAELIVVFTGTDERVREIAARYTDQIIPFTWCDDFAAARNAGLKKARGEWFMYIDDDEWFEDVTEICEFFTSGEYRKYGFAYYIQRNYTNWDGIKCTDFPAYRMVKRTPDLHFEDPIHEELFPRSGRHKVLRSYVHHYGYIKDTKKTNDGKTTRNTPLLLKDIERRPDYVKNYLQIVQEYCTQSDWDKAEEYCRKGRKLCKGTGDTVYQRWLQVYLAEVLFRKNLGIQAEEEIVSILEKEKPCQLVQMILYSLLIAMCEKRGDSEKLLQYGIRFEELLADMDKRPGSWMEQSYGYVNEDRVKNPERLYPGRLNCAKAALELQDYEKAEYFLKLLPWEEEYMIRQYYPLLDRWKTAYAPHMLELLAGLDGDSPYLLLQKLLFGEEEEKDQSQTPGQHSLQTQELWVRCLQELDQPYLQRQIIEKALFEKRDFAALLNRMDLESWKECIGEIVKDTPYVENPGLMEALDTLFEGHSLQGFWLKKLLLEKELTRGFLMKKELTETLREYAGCIKAFYQGQYREELFSAKSRYLLPADCRQALVFLEALENMEQGRLAEAVRYFGTALQIHPCMTGVIREFLRLLGNSAGNPGQTASAEFQGLATQMKMALGAMVQSGQYQQAMSVLGQLLPLMPEDMELLKLHQQLLERLADR